MTFLAPIPPRSRVAPGPAGSALLLTLWLAGCVASPPEVTRVAEPDTILTHENGPPGAREGSCWGRDRTPAVIETVTEQIVVAPGVTGPDGQVQQQPVYQTEASQRIVEERREIWFETPCVAALTPEFVSSLQRALSARRAYAGPINGVLDQPTRAAIRAYQRPLGLNSGVLALSTARELGLAAHEFSEGRG